MTTFEIRALARIGLAAVGVLAGVRRRRRRARKRRSRTRRAPRSASSTSRRRPAGVMLRLSLKGLPAGERAFHIHAVGKCEAPFATRRRSLQSRQPEARADGAGPGHAGDMPNLHVPASGELVVEILNAAVTLEKGKPNSLFHGRRHGDRHSRRQGRLQERSGGQRRRPHRLRRDPVAGCRKRCRCPGQCARSAAPPLSNACDMEAGP